MIYWVKARYWLSIHLPRNKDIQPVYGNTKVNIYKPRWHKPPEQWLECNVEGSFTDVRKRSRGEWVMRDCRGTYIKAGQGQGRNINSALKSELQVLLMALQHCWSGGCKKVIFEGDSKKAISIIYNQSLHFDAYNWIREINWWRQNFREFDLLRWDVKVADAMFIIKTLLYFISIYQGV